MRKPASLRSHRKISTFILPITLMALGGCQTTSMRSPEIRTDDVGLFYSVYDAAGGRPTAEALQRDYLDKGSDGLKRFAQLRDFTGTRIAAAIAEHPEVFVEAKSCAAALPRIKQRLAASLVKLKTLYPAARFPPVTIAISRAKPVGVGRSTGVYIGLDALCAWKMPDPNVENRFVHVITHEYVHVQQPASEQEDTGQTVLMASLTEGGAELLAELTSGSVSYTHLAKAVKGREEEIERKFLNDLDKGSMGSAWLYNGEGTPQWPGDLGYWVGYRIAKAYYLKVADKKAAIKDIIEVSDPHLFLARSGWKHGIKLD